MKCGKKLGKLIFLKRKLEDESTKSKIMKFGQDSRRNDQVNEIEISKLNLKLTKITI